MRMDVPGVRACRRHHVHPQAVQFKLSPPEVELKCPHEVSRARIENGREFGECGIAPRKVVERGIRGVAGIGVFLGPAPSRGIVLRQSGGCAPEPGIQVAGPGGRELHPIELRRK